MWRLILMAMSALLLTPQTRNLPVPPEPSPLPIPSPIVGGDVFLPLIFAKEQDIRGEDAIIYGYASPHSRMYRVPFYNWSARSQLCANKNFWPMLRGQGVDPDLLEKCNDGQRTLLLYNEPELGHFSASPQEAADMLHEWASLWTGPIACCGNFYGDGGGELTGLEWFLAFVAAYQDTYGTAPPIDAIHMHVYEQGALDVAALQAWRKLATWGGWVVIVSESGTFPSEAYTVDEIAARLPGFLSEVEDVLQPDMLMWFSDYIQPWALGRGTAWHRLNLTEADGSLTPVGEAWEAWTGRTIDEDRAK